MPRASVSAFDTDFPDVASDQSALDAGVQLAGTEDDVAASVIADVLRDPVTVAITIGF